MSVKKKKSLLEINISLMEVSLAEKVVFSKHLAIMLRSGMSIIEALDIFIESAQGKFKKTLKEVRLSIRAGHTLSDSLAHYPKTFSDLYINVMRAGEKSGTLVENLENLAEGLRKEKELTTKIKGALIYPIMVLIATFVLGMVLSFVVLPKITPLFKGLKVDLPITTRGLIWFTDIIQAHGFYLFSGIVFFVIFTLWLVNRKFSKPVTHWLMLHTPVLRGIVFNTNLSRFSSTLGMLIKSGVNIDEALDIVRETMGNYYFQKALDDISLRVHRGVKLSESLEACSDLFPKLFTRMVLVGEESGKYEETLFYLADMYEGEVDTSTKALSTILEPALLLFIGVVVGFLAISIIAPIYDITGNIKQ